MYCLAQNLIKHTVVNTLWIYFILYLPTIAAIAPVPSPCSGRSPIAVALENE